MSQTYKIRTKVWLYPGMNSTGSPQSGRWHFASIDKKISVKIKEGWGNRKRRGWGSVPVKVTLGKSSWKTSIFPDKNSTYLLPIKKEVRKKEAIFDGDSVTFRIEIK
ncbi:MAG TPA: DUF1905 domain-containing protein [Candidatus Paceibacterota bacterium]